LQTVFLIIVQIYVVASVNIARIILMHVASWW